ncbi:MAG: PAS domain S-box protein [Saccharospirillum sp.]|nr:PAS domain S-box protein [Saccharospirillum sp.]
MKLPELPDNEAERLSELKRLSILDTTPESRFDQLTSLAQYTFDVEIVLVSLVDENRQWFKSCQGLDARQTDRSISFCGHAINESQVMVISDAKTDVRFEDNPLVTGPPFIRFYAGAQLRSPEGLALGTLCLIDSRPRSLDDQAQHFLRVLANQVERELYMAEWREFQKQQQEAQRHSIERERLLRTIIDNLPVNIYVKDLDHRKVMANKAEQRFLGVENEEDLIGLTDAETYPDQKEMIEIGANEDHEVTVNGTSIIKKEDYAVNNQGELTWFQVSKLPLLNAQDEINGLVGISVDITKEKASREAKSRQLMALRLLHEISSEIGTDIGTRVNQALRVGLDYLGVDVGVVSEIEKGAYNIRWLQSNIELPPQKAKVWRLEDSYGQLLFENDGYLIVEHMAKSPYSEHPAYLTHRFESFLGTILIVNGRTVGALTFYSRQPRTRPFDDGERLFLRILGQWVAADMERSLAEETLRELANQVPGMLYQYRLWPDGRGAFVYSSPGIKDIYQVTPEEVVEDASIVFERIHNEDLSRVSDSIEKSAENLSRWECQYRVRDMEGGYQWVEGYATPRRTANGGTTWYGYIHNVNDRKRNEQVKSEFVSTVSHELRTPLTAIGGTLRLISGGVAGDLPDKALEMVQIAIKNTERLTRLINELLDLEKLSAGQLNIVSAPISIAAFLRSCINMNEVYAGQFGVSLILLDGGKDVELEVDMHRLEQVITNLISNAVKFSPANGQVTVGWKISGTNVEVFVKDEGVGIPPAFHDRVFERFTQADSSDRRSKGGTGLGLAISRELTELMNGTIWFESEEGVGTTFFLRFPLYSPPHGAIDSQVSEQE